MPGAGLFLSSSLIAKISELRWPDMGMVAFAQIHTGDVRQIYWPTSLKREIMATAKNSRRKEYMRYAEHCLSMVTVATDQDARSIQREMAAEWIRLAETVRLPPAPRRNPK